MVTKNKSLKLRLWFWTSSVICFALLSPVFAWLAFFPDATNAPSGFLLWTSGAYFMCLLISLDNVIGLLEKKRLVEAFKGIKRLG